MHSEGTNTMTETGTIFAILGASIGVAGGAYGTWRGICKASTIDERRFLVKASLIFWVYVVGFVALILLMASNWKWLLYVLYIPILFVLISWCNKRIASIRANHNADST